jgi:hypothetical protein
MHSPVVSVTSNSQESSKAFAAKFTAVTALWGKTSMSAKERVDMSVNDQSAASRQFVASSPALSAKWWTGKRAYIWLYGWIAVFLVLFWLVGFKGLNPAAAFVPAVAAVGLAAAYFFWRSRRRFLITVTRDGLTVGRRRGDLYSFVDAELGPWVTMGVALHLQCGRHRFVLGGRDRRVAPATPLNAPPVQAVDAWLSASDFDELLSVGGRWGGSAAARGPAPGEPTRCLLFRNPLLIQQMGSYAFGKKRRLMLSLSHPQLFVDVDNGAIRVIDPNSNAVNVSASLSQVTATPATYRPRYRYGSLSSASSIEENIAANAMNQYLATTRQMVVCVPGLQPVTIGCRDFSGPKRRFS